jgi:hypothetical protein
LQLGDFFIGVGFFVTICWRSKNKGFTQRPQRKDQQRPQKILLRTLRIVFATFA